MKKALFLSLVVFALAPAAWALCQDCVAAQCLVITPGGGGFVDGTRCSGSQSTGDHGYENCRNLEPCRGCMGWTCTVRDPLDVELRVISVTIEPEQPATEAPAPQD